MGTIHIPGGTERLAAGCGPCPLHLPQRELDDELLLDMWSSFLLPKEIVALRKTVKRLFEIRCIGPWHGGRSANAEAPERMEDLRIETPADRGPSDPDCASSVFGDVPAGKPGALLR